MRRLSLRPSEWSISRVLVVAILIVTTAAVVGVETHSFFRARREVMDAYRNSMLAFTTLLKMEEKPSLSAEEIKQAAEDPAKADALEDILRSVLESLQPLGVIDVIVIVTTRDGKFEILANAHPLPEAEAPPGRRRGLTVESTEALSMALSGYPGRANVTDVDGRWIVQYYPLHVSGKPQSLLAVYVPRRVVGQYLLRDLAFGGLVSVALVLLFAMLLAVRVARRLAAPMRRIVTVARSLEKADFSARVPEVGHNELTELGHAINEMADGLQSRDSEIRETQRVALFGLATLAEKRDRETGEHLYRTRAFCNALARRLKADSPYSDRIDKTFLENLDLVAPLHDIGKVAIADRILFKPESLTDDETALMRQHVAAGADTLKASNGELPTPSPLLSMAEQIARYHHERWDGSGYLEGLAGDDIPLAARIFALADVYDALRSERVYKPALPHDEVRRRIVEVKGAQFDPVIVEAFLAVESRFVALSNRRWPELLARLPEGIKNHFPV